MGVHNDSDSLSREELISQLSRVVIVGNSFEIYIDRDDISRPGAIGTAAAIGRTSLIQSLKTCTQERLLTAFDPHPEAFNDLAVLTFPAEKISAWFDKGQTVQDEVPASIKNDRR